jgi:hypothetical protein
MKLASLPPSDLMERFVQSSFAQEISFSRVNSLFLLFMTDLELAGKEVFHFDMIIQKQPDLKMKCLNLRTRFSF